MLLARVEMEVSSFRAEIKAGLRSCLKSSVSGERQQQELVSGGTAAAASFLINPVLWCSGAL